MAPCLDRHGDNMRQVGIAEGIVQVSISAGETNWRFAYRSAVPVLGGTRRRRTWCATPRN